MFALRRLPLTVLALLPLVPLSGCAVYHKCGLDGCPEDAQITAKIEALLYDNKAIAVWDIQVQTLNRTVYLYGLVDTNVQRSFIEDTARETAGVEKVVDSIAIRGNVY
jgi:osmotically-inducible protein OsmY